MEAPVGPASERPNWFMGTGVTRTERLLVWIVTGVGAVLVGALAWHSDVSWQWWQWLVIGALTVDIVGGPAANALGSSKLLYHRPLPLTATPMQRLVHHPVAFTAGHVQPFVAALVLPGQPWRWAFGVYAMALLGVVLVHAAPLYLARPVAFAAATIGVIVHGALDVPIGMEWFGPLLLVKLVLAHSVPEQPYRPDGAATDDRRSAP